MLKTIQIKSVVPIPGYAQVKVGTVLMLDSLIADELLTKGHAELVIDDNTINQVFDSSELAPSASEWFVKNGKSPIWINGQEYISNGVNYLVSGIKPYANTTELEAYLSTRQGIGQVGNKIYASDEFGDVVEVGASGGGAGSTNLSTSVTASNITINSSSGTDALINSASSTVAGAMTADSFNALTDLKNGNITELKSGGISVFSAIEVRPNVNRPVASGMSFTANPTTAVEQTTDFHGLDVHYSSVGSNFNGSGAMPSAIYAFESSAMHDGTGVIARLVGTMGQAVNNLAGIVDEGVGLRLINQNRGTGKMTVSKNITIDGCLNSGGGTPPTHQYGIFISDLTIATSANYAIYTGKGKVRFGDGLIIVNNTATTSLSVDANAAGAAGLWASNISCYDYGSKVITFQNGGISFQVQKEGTGAGTVASIVNKGTGNTLQCTDGTSTVWTVSNSGIMSLTQYRLNNLNTAPASSSATGQLGEIRFTADFVYLCIATNTWVRAALSTF